MGVAFVQPNSPYSVNELEQRRPSLAKSLTLILACVSQLLYLALIAAGQLHWIRFYPGNPVQVWAIFVGLFLSISAFVASLFASGRQRAAGIVGAIITAFLWLMSAVASAAV